MLLVTIDIGTYSIKILESRVDKKKLRHIRKEQKVIPLSMELPPPPSNEEKIKSEEVEKSRITDEQFKMLETYFNQLPESAKIIFQVPNEICSTRFIHVPVKNRKKAEQMIPFQLEEDIPYTLGQVHLSHALKKTTNGFYSVSSFVPFSEFQAFYNRLDNQNCLPMVVTTEVSNWAQYVSETQGFKEQNFCILDIGHNTTNAYFFANKKLVAYNIGYVAGRSIDEMIKENYKVSLEQAIEFKHENSFLLISEQYDEVDDKQREFAVKMDETFQQLIKDFKRWDLSYRVNHNKILDKIYVTGGTAKTKNIENYLARNLEKPVDFITDIDHRFQSVSLKDNEILSYSTSNALSTFYINRQGANNFLTGDFATLKSEELPIYSIGYVGWRMALITAIFFMFLSIEGYFLQKRESQVDRDMLGILSNDALDISQTERRTVRKRPEIVESKISKKLKSLKDEIHQINNMNETNGLMGLFEISKKVRTNCQLLKYEDSPSGHIEASFGECDDEDIQSLNNILKNSYFSDAEINTNSAGDQVLLKFKL
ncbi:MAG: cell division FtsA domain-containing protein [Halobacteriovoraceae bacterium]|nr:cell division FtsA domain-containing protein [Halobacteriovoraceae bacterium]